MSKETDNDKKFEVLTSYFGLLWAICLGIPLALGVWMFLTAGAMPDEVKDWGVFGDFVGGISNPFISAFTFLALIITIIQNQKVLRINEQELEETRKEIALTREANEKQAAEFKLQNEMIRKDSEVESIVQALLQLASKIQKDWSENPSGGPRPINAFAMPYQVTVQSASDHNTTAKNNLAVAMSFVPLLVSYVRLLILFFRKDPFSPMLTSVVCLLGDVLTLVRTNGYLEIDLTEDEDELLVGLLNTHYDGGFKIVAEQDSKPRPVPV